jgi:hypothetical protein
MDSAIAFGVQAESLAGNPSGIDAAGAWNPSAKTFDATSRTLPTSDVNDQLHPRRRDTRVGSGGLDNADYGIEPSASFAQLSMRDSNEETGWHRGAMDSGPSALQTSRGEDPASIMLGEIMSLFGHFYHSWVDRILSRNGVEHHQSPSGDSQTPGKTPTNGYSGSSTYKRKQKRVRTFGDDEEVIGRDEDEDDEEQETRPKRKERKTDGEVVRKLACPFYKRNPPAYGRLRSCPGPGWNTVHRLK